ncbi:ABC transporter substrate-binding protein [Streptomyces boluensis]|uniref:Uncharacterized protein n=1 Tax=Streptomyces boluensis TaxID=1775135 RepID=A0A964ULT1_9ACTN|nr:ABC transporter substrate-binding protein [Streptomyces boluensis]NBE50465.1 hypothetical protein [Streptomyces boluensis]
MNSNADERGQQLPVGQRQSDPVPQPLIDPPHAPKRRGLRAAVVALVLVLVAGYVAYELLTPPECAEGIAETDDGQCVGLSDGSHAFPGLAGISEKIHRENQRVADEKPVTVVHMESMSGGSGDRGKEATLEAVTGAYLAQRTVNQERGTRPRIRLLLANTGNGDAYADDVADAVLERRKTERLAAVVGVGQSNSRTLAAVRRLRDAGVPTVGATVAADKFVSSRAGFFRVSFPASDQAQAAAAYLKQEQDAAERAAKKAGRKADYDVQVVWDRKEDDGYNKALRETFGKAAKERGVHVRPGFIPVWSDAGGGAGNALHGAADKICRKGEERPDAVFFAGRGREIRSLIEAAGEAGRRCAVTLVSGSSAVGVFFDTTGASHSEELKSLDERWAASGMRVLYTAFTHPEVAARVYGTGANSPYPKFERDYLAARGGTPDALADGQAMLGHDAVLAVGRAARAAYSNYPGSKDVAADVRAELGQLNGGNVVRGVTGEIAFHEQTGEPVDRPMALVRLHRPGADKGRFAYVKALYP